MAIGDMWLQVAPLSYCIICRAGLEPMLNH